MFSIAAINDATEAGGKREEEPLALAPTKEAQEFHLSQTYHDGLLKLQAGDYAGARQLLEAVLGDPLVSRTVDVVDGHLLQLRFLALKNLASCFLQQGSAHYENALGCYLQAVEIDSNDSVVWNQLGTLSCTMGLLSTSRWAFEQGLFCSPSNGNCMEKLLEVLVAVGDEVACLSVANLVLRHWPSHSRALHVKRIIEGEETLAAFSPRGIDRLEPRHVRLKFPNKRKADDEDNKLDEENPLKKANYNIEILLPGATWEALADGILGILLPSHGRAPQLGIEQNFDGKVTEKVARMQSIVATETKATLDICSGPEDAATTKDVMRLTDVKITIKLPPGSELLKDSRGDFNATAGDSFFGKSSELKERESFIEEEQPQERRSSRLERLRSRKPGKEELDSASNKDLAKTVFQFLEPFILNRARCKDNYSDGSSFRPSSGILTHSPACEYNSVIKFINVASKNCGAYHLGHLLLDEISHNEFVHQTNFVKFLDLEKLTRQWPQDRTPSCSLFLAELYYDHAICAENESKRAEFLSEVSFHLCKVIELVALDSESDFSRGINHVSNSQVFQEEYEGNRNMSLLENKYECVNISDASPSSVAEDSNHQGPTVKSSLSDSNNVYYIRFFWMSACLSLSSGCTAKAIREFSVCLSILRHHDGSDGSVCCIPLPHCKIIQWLNSDRVLHQINLLKIEELLKQTTAEMMGKGMYKDCINMLVPILHSIEDVYPELLSGVSTEKGATTTELLALDVLLSACERVKPIEICTYLNAHRQKLRVLAAAAGMFDSNASEKYSNGKIVLKGSDSDLETAETARKHWYQMVDKEVKEISRCASLVKNFIDQNDTCEALSTMVCIIGDIQTLLLTVMYNFARMVLGQMLSGPGSLTQTDQMETQCLVDAAIAFCKLQHLDPTVSIKSQVELIAAVHDLLAEYGLCCAGKDSEGKEGTFLKLAIKHLFTLDVKLKSNFQLASEKSETKLADVSMSAVDDKMFASQVKSSSMKDTSTHGKEECEFQEERTPECLSIHEALENEEAVESGKDDAELTRNVGHNSDGNVSNLDTRSLEVEREKLELGIDNALDQNFFCLYGLNIKSGQDSCCEDDLAIHKNTNRGDYQTKEQCADVFQYILPYAKVSSRGGIVKLRRVLRAIHKHFPQPSDDILAENIIDKFLDSPDFCDDKLYEVAEIDGNQEAVMDILYSNGRGETTKTLSVTSSGPYLEVYSNLYYLIAQAEEMSATDKFAGFVLNKEGAEFVEQNANLFKYDLLYNPLHFESWQKLANIYDEEVDLLLNDGSKHINIMDWGKNATLHQRVERGRRRSRRCLLMSLALARTPTQQSQIHELLGLVYYDSLQNVVPFYDQRCTVPTKDELWLKFCQNSLKHFEEALELKPDWVHAFYLGKLCEKMGYSSDKAFSYYNKAMLLNPSAVDPYYRMHASRLKLLYNSTRDMDSLKIAALYSFNQSTKQSICDIFGWTNQDLHQPSVELMDSDIADVSVKRKMAFETHHLDEAWDLLYKDCLLALEICIEGELKHYHKARYMLAQGLYKRSGSGDLERAKDELSFCFRSSRSSFTINMWEIDGLVKKGKRKTPGASGSRRVLEVSLPESSRKFITCIRKYILFYLNLLEKSKDLCTLERAYTYLRTDRRFSLCLGDIVQVALGRYIKTLTMSICYAKTVSSADSSASLEHLLEKLFHILMDHVNLWAEISSLPDVKCPELSEMNLYGFIHQYIYLLESDMKLDVLEGINEKIRKRFKNPKLASVNSSKMCKHASLAWCRSILVMLASITPVLHSGNGTSNTSAADCSETGPLLFADVQPDELCNLSSESIYHPKDLEMKWCHALLKIRKVRIQKALEENMEMAHILLRSTYNFYKESSCGMFPSGINLYTVSLSSQFLVEELWQPGKNGIEILDLSIPRKLLLWAYSLVHGHYSNILVVVKYCEENAKPKLKRGSSASTSLPQSTVSTCFPQTGCGKEKNLPEDKVGVEENLPIVRGTTTFSVPSEIPKPLSAASQLQPCGKEPVITQAGSRGNNDAV